MRCLGVVPSGTLDCIEDCAGKSFVSFPADCQYGSIPVLSRIKEISNGV